MLRIISTILIIAFATSASAQTLDKPSGSKKTVDEQVDEFLEQIKRREKEQAERRKNLRPDRPDTTLRGKDALLIITKGKLLTQNGNQYLYLYKNKGYGCTTRVGFGAASVWCNPVSE